MKGEAAGQSGCVLGVEQLGSVRPCAPESPEDTMTEMPRAPMAAKPELQEVGR